MADLTLALTGNAATGSVGTAGVKLTLQDQNGIAGVQATGAIGTLGAPGTVAMVLPTPQFISTQAGTLLKLPMPVMQASGLEGNIGSVAMTLPLPQLSLDMLGRDGALGTFEAVFPLPQLQAAGNAGLIGSVAMTLPMPAISISVPNSAALTLPTPQFQAQGSTGLVGTAAMTLPVPQVSATASAPFTGAVAMALPVPVMEIAGLEGGAAQMRAQLAMLALSAQGMTGSIGTVAMVLPVGRFTASGYQPGIGGVQLVLPMLQMQATGVTARAPNAPAPTTIAMQTEMLSLTTYSNYPFNSFAKFNGLFLGASDTGIFALTGATDNGVAIQSAARVGMTDFGTSHLKRIDKIYVGYRADGNLVLRVFTDEITQRDYLLQSSQRVGLHGNHARLGKGLVARYWQFEVRNQNGGDFSMDIIELKPVKLARRVGGNDA